MNWKAAANKRPRLGAAGYQFFATHGSHSSTRPDNLDRASPILCSASSTLVATDQGSAAPTTVRRCEELYRTFQPHLVGGGALSVRGASDWNQYAPPATPARSNRQSEVCSCASENSRGARAKILESAARSCASYMPRRLSASRPGATCQLTPTGHATCDSATRVSQPVLPWHASSDRVRDTSHS